MRTKLQVQYMADLAEKENSIDFTLSASKIPSDCVAKQLALPTSDHGVSGSNPAEGEILSEPKRRFIAQSLSCSPFHRPEMT